MERPAVVCPECGGELQQTNIVKYEVEIDRPIINMRKGNEMNKIDAKKIAEHNITVGEIKAMLRRAYEAGAADDRPCRLNSALSNAMVYNIFLGSYQNEPDVKIVNDSAGRISAMNAIYVFGEYWDGWVPEKKTATHKPVVNCHHEDPLPPPF